MVTVGRDLAPGRPECWRFVHLLPAQGCTGLGAAGQSAGSGILVCPRLPFFFLVFPKRRGSCGTVRPHSCEAGTGLDAYWAFLGQGRVEGSKRSSQWLCAEVLT